MPLDISGRSGYRTGNDRTLPLTLSTMGRLYGGRFYDFLNALRIWLTYQTRWKKVWQAQLQMADRLVIGGGKLLMDNHLDFPLKLYLLANLAQGLQIPYLLLAVGVGDKWSPLGLRWMRSVVRGAQTVSVRDEASLYRIRSLFKRLDIILGSDPALWAADLYGRNKTKESAKIGINLINLLDFNEQRYPQAQISPHDWVSFWKTLILALSRSGLTVELFTNGNQLDEELTNQVWQDVISQAPQVIRAPRPRCPNDLAKQVQNYHLIIATRLHTNILAASYNIPVVALSWDDKVYHFFREMERTEWVFSPTSLSPDLIVGAILQENRFWNIDVLMERKQSILAAIQTLLVAEWK